MADGMGDLVRLQLSSDMQHIASIVECVMEVAYLAVFAIMMMSQVVGECLV